MTSHEQLLAQFRSQLTRSLKERDKDWESSRRLVDAVHLTDTLHRLVERVRAADLTSPIKDSLLAILDRDRAQRVQELPGPELKAVTGLPPTKALRALCVYFDLAEPARSRWAVPSLASDSVAAFVRDCASPLDLLLTANVPSLLDLGAGDLSFAKELVDCYGPQIRRHEQRLILHCVDRLNPQSKLGGPLHASQEVVQMLKSRPDVSFRFLPGQDMFAFDGLADAGTLAARYAVTTCWAPASPTFAYEPTRLSAEVIHAQLEATKGAFRHTRYGGEEALEVHHRDRTLLFPPWKFDIRGPLALLDLVARSGYLGLLAAVDSQVFWELLAQLLDDERFRPKDEPFTSENLSRIFGDVHERLSTLSIGETLDLTSCGPIRASLPRILPGRREEMTYRFRRVAIRRGAVFPGMPASSTARRFRDMTEESPPWMIMLVPDV